MICPHPRFLELHTDVQASSELVTARCRDCRHVWTIADAQYRAAGERPGGIVLQGDLMVEAVEP